MGDIQNITVSREDNQFLRQYLVFKTHSHETKKPCSCGRWLLCGKIENFLSLQKRNHLPQPLVELQQILQPSERAFTEVYLWKDTINGKPNELLWHKLSSNKNVFPCHLNAQYVTHIEIDCSLPAFVDNSSYVANHHKTHFSAACRASVLIGPGFSTMAVSSGWPVNYGQ